MTKTFKPILFSTEMVNANLLVIKHRINMIENLQFYEVKPGKLCSYRKMKMVSLTTEQQKYVLDNRNKNRTIEELSKDLGISFGKLYHNMRLMGLVKKKRSSKEIAYLLWNYTV